MLDISGQNWLRRRLGVDISPLQNSIWFMVDVNGDKKPNRFGNDIFHFVLTPKGIIPSGQDSNSAYCTSQDVEDTVIDPEGLGVGREDCTAKVLRENKLPKLE